MAFVQGIVADGGMLDVRLSWCRVAVGTGCVWDMCEGCVVSGGYEVRNCGILFGKGGAGVGCVSLRIVVGGRELVLGAFTVEG